MSPTPPSPTAILLPCLDEAAAIGGLLDALLMQFPASTIHVFDNCSTDATADIARSKGVRVISSPRRGKGHVVRHMFRAVEAEHYLMLDGDGTYCAKEAMLLLERLDSQQLDMVIGDRSQLFGEAQLFRRVHVTGNRVCSGIITALYKTTIYDTFSGYRAFSRRFVKQIPLQAQGFDIELEMTMQALAMGFRVGSVDISYRCRPAGGRSKLHTLKDGGRVIRRLLQLLESRTVVNACLGKHASPGSATGR